MLKIRDKLWLVRLKILAGYFDFPKREGYTRVMYDATKYDLKKSLFMDTKLHADNYLLCDYKQRQRNMI